MDPARASFLKTIGWSVAAGLIAVTLYAGGLFFLSAQDPKLADELGMNPQLYFHVGSVTVFALVTGAVLLGMMVMRWRKSQPK